MMHQNKKRVHETGEEKDNRNPIQAYFAPGVDSSIASAFATTGYPVMQFMPSDRAEEIFEDLSGEPLTYDSLTAAITGGRKDIDLSEVKTMFGDEDNEHELSEFFEAIPARLRDADFLAKLMLIKSKERQEPQIKKYKDTKMARTSSGTPDVSDPQSRLRFALMQSGKVPDPESRNDSLDDNPVAVNGSRFQFANQTGFFLMPNKTGDRVAGYKEPPGDYPQLIKHMKKYPDKVNALRTSLGLPDRGTLDANLAQLIIHWLGGRQAQSPADPVVAGLNKIVAITTAELARQPLFEHMRMPVLEAVANGEITDNLEDIFPAMWGGGEQEAQALRFPLAGQNIQNFERHIDLVGAADQSSSSSSSGTRRDRLRRFERDFGAMPDVKPLDKGMIKQLRATQQKNLVRRAEDRLQRLTKEAEEMATNLRAAGYTFTSTTDQTSTVNEIDRLIVEFMSIARGIDSARSRKKLDDLAEIQISALKKLKKQLKLRRSQRGAGK